MSTIQAVLFDRDNTLAITDRAVYVQAARWVAERWHLDPAFAQKTMIDHWIEASGHWWHLRTEQDEELFWKGYGEQLAHKLGLAVESAAELLDFYPYQRFLKPVPHSLEVLTELRRRGLKVGVLSNTLPSIRLTLQQIGLDHLVDVALASCTLGVHKPELEVFQQAAQAMDTPAGQILFVDDLAENVLAARQAGMQAIRIDLQGRETHAIHSLPELLDRITV